MRRRIAATSDNPWCLLWRQFEKHLDKPVWRWLELAGMGQKGPEARWLAVFKYKVADVGRLVRPTQLDAKDYVYHFPSPASEPTNAGGRAMDCGASDEHGPAGPLSEFIHDQIEYKFEHWFDAGSLLQRVEFRLRGALPEQRVRHHNHLCRLCNCHVLNWMPDPSDPTDQTDGP